MNITDIKYKFMDRKEFNTTDTRTRNRILNTIDALRNNPEFHEEQEGLLISDEKELTRYIDSCISNGIFVLDLETTGLDCFSDAIVGVCIYTPGEKPSYVPINHTDIDNKRLEGQLNENLVRSEVYRLMTSPSKYINQNTKFDLKFLKQVWDIPINEEYLFWDTQLGAFILNENEPTHALKPLYDKYILKQKDTGAKFKDLFGKTPFNYIPLDLAKIYGANDGIKTYRLYEFQKQYLDLNHKRPDMRKLAEVFFNIEMKLLPVVIDMELTGIELDLVRAKELDHKYEGNLIEYQEILTKIVEKYQPKIDKHKDLQPLIAKSGFNLNSPIQLQYLLYDIWKLPKVNKTSTDKGTLELLLQENLKEDYKYFIETLLNYKQMQKLVTAFIQKLPKEIKSDGCIHGRFNQIGAKTLRFSSSDPNLQQLPSRASDIRGMFKAREGCVLIGSDLSQIEPRILASLSQDATMIESYVTGVDLYSKMASQVYNVPYDDCREFHPVTGEYQKEGKKRRSSVKSLLLGIMYSRGAKSIGEQLGISEKEAQNLINDFYKSFPKVKELERITKLGAIQDGYVTTMFGSKRRLPDIKSKDKWTKARAERQCLNAKIQGTGALLLKISLIEIYNNPRLKELGGKILLTVHDENIVECPVEHAIEVGEILSDTMKSVCERHLGLVQKCDVEYAFRWGEPIDIQEVL